MHALKTCTPLNDSKNWTKSLRYLGSGARVCKLVLFTHKKSHTGFRLELKVVTLKSLKCIIAVILHYFIKFGSFGAKCVTEMRHTLSATEITEDVAQRI